MAITFHCEHCGRKIEAADNSAGKWGNCPACHNKVYIPDPKAAGEEIKLSPIDEETEKTQKELLDETFRLTQDILSEKETGGEESAGGEVSDRQLTQYIISYLTLMSQGDLAEAEAVLKQITPSG